MNDSQSIKDQVTHVMALQLTRQRQERELTLVRHILIINIALWLMLVSFACFLALVVMRLSDGTFGLDSAVGLLLTAVAVLVIFNRRRGLTSELAKTREAVAT